MASTIQVRVDDELKTKSDALVKDEKQMSSNNKRMLKGKESFGMVHIWDCMCLGNMEHSVRRV